MRRLLWLAAALLPALPFLGGCAQDLGGITKVDASFSEAGLPSFTYHSGKEAGGLDMVFTKSAEGAISVTVGAGEVTAFEGQAIQAERIRAQTEAIAGAIRDLLPSLLRDALCAAGLTADCAPP